jgi:flagellin-like protein
MMTIMGKRFTNRGISTIIAALLLIAIAIAAGVLLYVFSMGLIGSLQGSGGQQVKDQLVMEAYQWPSTFGTLTLDLRNTGSSTINIGAATYYVGGALESGACGTFSSGSSATGLVPGGTCVDAITIGTPASFSGGVGYVLKIGLADGGMMSYSVIAGQSQ